MSCDFPGKLTALEKLGIQELLSDGPLKSQVSNNELMYTDLILKELTYKLPVFDDDGNPVYRDGALVYEERDRTVAEIIARIVEWMLNVDLKLLGLLKKTIETQSTDLSLPDGACLLCKYYVDKIYGRLTA